MQRRQAGHGRWMGACGRAVLAVGLTAAATLTAVMPARERVSPPARAAEDASLEGHWRTFANGDRIRGVLREGEVAWAATEGGGLVRWDLDARTFRQYLHPQDGLPSNDVFAVTRVAGRLWLATARGLAGLDDATGDVEVVTPDTSPGMPARYVTALAPADATRLWVGFAAEWDRAAPNPAPGYTGTGDFRLGGLARFDTVAGTWDEVAHVEIVDTPGKPTTEYRTIPSENVTVLEVDPGGILWVGTRPYFVWEPETCVPGTCTGEGGEWVPVGGGLAARQDERWQQWTLASDSGTNCYTNHVTDLAVDPAGRTWVATRGRGVLAMADGLSRVGCGNQVRYERGRQSDQMLRGNMVWSVAVDDQGRVWVGHGDSPTHGEGIAVLDHAGTLDDWDTPWSADDNWTYLGFDDVTGKSPNLVTVLEVAGPAPHLIGAVDDVNGDGPGLRLYQPDGETWTPLRTADAGLPSNRIAGIAVDAARDQTWFALQRRGVARYDQATGGWDWWRAYANAGAVAAVTADTAAGARRIAVDLQSEAEYQDAFPTAPRYARVGHAPTLYEVTGYAPRLSGNGPYLYLSPLLAHDARAGNPIQVVTRGPASDAATQIDVAADGTAWVGGLFTLWRDGVNPGSNCPTYPQCYIDGGLARWDGQAWHVFNDTNSDLPRNGAGAVQVGAVAVDQAGRVWAGTGDRESTGDGVGVLDPASGQWTIHAYRTGLTAGDGVADFDVDPATGEVWTAHHPVVGYITLPNGEQHRYFDGGGIARWDGAGWRSWFKPTAGIRAFGDKGITEAVLVDRVADRVWLGGWDGDPLTFHWLRGENVDAAVNWCPLAGCGDGDWTNAVWPDDGTVGAIALDAAGRVWVGTNRAGAGVVPPEAGVKLLADATWQTLTPENSDLVDQEITALAAQGGRMWVGTWSSGVSLHLPEPPPTPTPTRTPTAVATATATFAATEEATPTPRDTATATPSATVTASPTPSATATRHQPGCGEGGPCLVFLPLAARRR